MIVLDDFVRDENIIRKINDPQTHDEKNFWQGEFDLYKGWEEVGTGCFVHEFIKYIFTDDRLKNQNVGVKFYEFWTNSLGPQNIKNSYDETWGMLPHFDKDESLLKYKNKYHHPKIGIVYYGSKDIEDVVGGEFCFWPEIDTSFDLCEEVPLPSDYKVVSPLFNRLVLFDSSKLHGVKEIEFGTRKVIAVNLWEEKPFNDYDYFDED